MAEMKERESTRRQVCRRQNGKDDELGWCSLL